MARLSSPSSSRAPDPGQVVEARAADLGAALGVDGAEQLAQLHVVGRSKPSAAKSRGVPTSCSTRSRPRRLRARRARPGCRTRRSKASRWLGGGVRLLLGSLTGSLSALAVAHQAGLLRPWLRPRPSCRGPSARRGPLELGQRGAAASSAARTASIRLGVLAAGALAGADGVRVLPQDLAEIDHGTSVSRAAAARGADKLCRPMTVHRPACSPTLELALLVVALAVTRWPSRCVALTRARRLRARASGHPVPQPTTSTAAAHRHRGQPDQGRRPGRRPPRSRGSARTQAGPNRWSSRRRPRTTRQGQTRAALDAGVDAGCALGGDGTVREVAGPPWCTPACRSG